MATCNTVDRMRRTRISNEFGSSVYAIEFRELCYDSQLEEATAVVAFGITDVTGSGLFGEWEYSLVHEDGTVLHNEVTSVPEGWEVVEVTFPAHPGDSIEWRGEATWTSDSDSITATVPEPRLPDFQWEKLTDPKQADVGEQKVFEARVTNVGDGTGDVTYEIIDQGQVMLEHTFTLDPGQSEDAQFAGPAPDSPTWNVSIGPVEWTVEVTDASGGNGGGGSNGGNGGNGGTGGGDGGGNGGQQEQGISGGVLLVAAGAGYYLWRRHG